MSLVLRSLSRHAGLPQPYGTAILTSSTRYLVLAAAFFAGAMTQGAPTAAAEAPAAGSADKSSVPSIEVPGIRSPARWPYRAFLKGLDIFDDKRSLSPQGVLSFVLRPTAPLPENASVALDSEAGRQLLPLDGTHFTLPRIDKLDRRDTELTVAVRDTQFAQDRSASKPAMWGLIVEIGNLPLADVRPPGLPDNVFRLGDLRLSCMVSAAVFKDQTPWLFNAMLSGFIRSTNWCDAADASNFSPRSAQRFVALTMRDGAREQRFTYAEPRDQLPLPSLKQNWSDETQLIIEPAPVQP